MAGEWAWVAQAGDEFSPACADRRCEDCRAPDCTCCCHLPDRREWFCACGNHLSYGIYCKRCEEETDFAISNVTKVDRLVAYCQTIPPREIARADD